MNRRRIVATLAVSLVAPTAVLLSSGAASAAPGSTQVATSKVVVDGVRMNVPSSYQGAGQGFGIAAAGVTPPVGTVRQWLGQDDYNGTLYRKDYVLRGVGAHIEVWVAVDTSFPAGDCRGASSTDVTDAQVADYINQFDTVIYPRETATFSTPPDRDGSNAQLGPDANGHGGDYTGEGNKTVTLVDNVRDDNYYTFPAAPNYITGFFSAQLNELLDRNVVTIDAFDWTHRTGATPANQPTNDVCTSRPAVPRLYEAKLANSWQQLAEYYADPNETGWLNQGLSKFAESLTGYADPTKSVTQAGAAAEILCYQGYGTVVGAGNPTARDCGGPQNSLTLFDESATGGPADLGEAWAALLFYYDRFGADFIQRLHQDGQLQGLASLKAALLDDGQLDLFRSIHDFQGMTFLDQIVGGSKNGTMIGVNRWRVTTNSLKSTINLNNPAINDTPGVTPNGADYVPLKKAGGVQIKGSEINTLKFVGAPTLPSTPLAWTTVNNDPDRPGNVVLASPNSNYTDESAVIPVSVPTDDPTLRVLEKYGAEFSYDYGYVGVSTDNGATYTSIAGDKTVDGPGGQGINGTTNGFEPHSYDLSAYAGQNVLLAFRYVSDSGVNEGGWLIDDIYVGAVLVSDGTNLSAFKSTTQVRPIPVYAWNVRLIGYDTAKFSATMVTYEKATTINLTKTSSAVKQIASYPKVLVIVSYDEPTEQYRRSAPYTLTLNNIVQAGGGGF